MHVPPFYRRRSWQLFGLGLIAGGLVGYGIFLFMYGKMYSDLLTENVELEAEVKSLQQQNEILLHDKEQLQQEQPLTVQTIELHYINEKEFRFDRLTTHQLNELIKEELKEIVGKSVESIAENHELLIQLIEKKTFSLDDVDYHFIVRKLILTETLIVHLEVKFAK